MSEGNKWDSATAGAVPIAPEQVASAATDIVSRLRLARPVYTLKNLRLHEEAATEIDRLTALNGEMLEALEKARDSIVALGTYINVPGLEPAGLSLYAEGAAALQTIRAAISKSKEG